MGEWAAINGSVRNTCNLLSDALKSSDYTVYAEFVKLRIYIQAVILDTPRPIICIF